MDYLYFALASIIITSVLAVPTIGVLYKLEFYKTLKGREKFSKTRNELYYNFYKQKLATPEGFGIILVPALLFIGAYLNNPTIWKIVIIASAFGLIGFVDDYKKFRDIPKDGFWGVRSKIKLFAHLILASVAIYTLFEPTSLVMGLFFILSSVFIINSGNITDGLDGLFGGITLFIFITLLLFGYSLFSYFELALLGYLVGFLVVFLYFNVNPARVFLGDTGSMIIGFILSYYFIKVGPIGLIIYALLIAEGLSSALQIFWFKLFKKRLFKIAPLHLLLLNRGWGETKIVFRAWVVQITLLFVSYYLFFGI